MKQASIDVLLVILGGLASYAIGTVIAWNPYPGEWQEGNRMMWGLFTLIWSAIFLSCKPPARKWGD